MGGKTLEVYHLAELNGSFYGSVSVSCKVAANKEAARPEYQTQDSGNRDGVSPGVLDTVFQRRTAAAAAAGIRNGEGQNVRGGSYHK